MTVNTFPEDANSVIGEGLFDPASGTGVFKKAGTVATAGGVSYAPTAVEVPALLDTHTSGTAAADTAAVSIALPGGQATAVAQITGTWVGTLLFEGSADVGTTWVGITATSGSNVGTSTAANGNWRANIAGYTNFRVRMHPYTSGTASIRINVSAQPHNVTINNATSLGQSTKANSAPVTLASDQGNLPVAAPIFEVIGQAAGSVTSTSTPLVPQTDVSQYRHACLQLAGTWSMSLRAQGSNDGTTWTDLIGNNVPDNWNNRSFVMSANGLYSIPLWGFKYLRVMPTAFTSNASCVGTLELAAFPPQVPPEVVNSQLVPAVSGGTSRFHLVSAASTNATNVKAAAGQIYNATISNTNAAWRYVKVHNTAGTPTVGSGVVRTFAIPPNGVLPYVNIYGDQYTTGIAITTVTGSADSDTTAVGAGDLIIDIDIK